MKSKQLFFGLIGACVILAAGLGYGYYKETLRIKAETTALSRKSDDATLADEHLDQLKDLKHQYDALQPVLAKLDIALPHDKNQSTLILQLQQLAANAGMKLPGATFQANNGLPTSTSQTTKAGDVLALPVSFQLIGTYDQLQAFLQSLERLGRYSSISSLAITRADDKDPKSKNLNFAIQLIVYVKP